MTEIEVRRSARRQRTSQARREHNKIVVMIPAHLSAEEEQRVVAELVEKLEAKRSRRRAPVSDMELMTRAKHLSQQHLEGLAVPSSVRWVSNQNTRWGSCSFNDRTIRLSDRMRLFPQYVIDAVLFHELVHLIEPNHGTRFKQLVRRYPQHDQAEGFLQGVSWPR